MMTSYAVIKNDDLFNGHYRENLQLRIAGYLSPNSHIAIGPPIARVIITPNNVSHIFASVF